MCIKIPKEAIRREIERKKVHEPMIMERIDSPRESTETSFNRKGDISDERVDLTGQQDNNNATNMKDHYKNTTTMKDYYEDATIVKDYEEEYDTCDEKSVLYNEKDNSVGSENHEQQLPFQDLERQQHLSTSQRRLYIFFWSALIITFILNVVRLLVALVEHNS